MIKTRRRKLIAFLDSSGVTRLWQHIIAKLGNKVDKEIGKGLSTNDYTTTEKDKLAGIEDGANNYTLPVASSTLGGVRTTNTDELDLLTAQGYAPIPIVDGIPYFMPVSVLENDGFHYLTVGNLDLKIYNKGILSLSQGTTNGTIKYSFFNQQVNNVVESSLKIKGLDTAAYHPESYFVPATRTINNKALSANISLTASDVGAAASSHTHSYLPLTGGTLTGTLTAKALYASDGNVVGSHLVTQTNNYPEVYFKNAAGTTLADFYVDTTSGGFADTILKVHKDASSASFFCFRKDGELSCGSLALATALPISSGGTGATSAASALANLGAASSTLIRGQMKTFTIEGDKDHYYPVVFNVHSEYFVNRIAITRYYNDIAPNDWGTDTNHKGGLTFQFQWNGDISWGGNGTSTSLKVETLIETYCKMVGGMKLSTSGVVVWLRGGSALYKVLNEMGSAISITPYYNTFTDDDGKSFPVRTYDASVVDSEIQQRLVFLPLTGGTLTGNLGVNGIITAKTYLAVERNSNPQLALKNANSKPLAVLYTETSNGSYGNTHLQVYKSATESTTFTFGNTGNFRAYGNIYGSTLQVDGANNWPSLWFKCSSKTNPGVLLQTNELHGFGIYCYGSDLDTATTRYFEGYTFPAPATGLTANKTYTVYSEKNIIYSSSQPTGVKGAIWLKPV